MLAGEKLRTPRATSARGPPAGYQLIERETKIINHREKEANKSDRMGFPPARCRFSLCCEEDNS